jgi:hypothetical protein
MSGAVGRNEPRTPPAEPGSHGADLDGPRHPAHSTRLALEGAGAPGLHGHRGEGDRSERVIANGLHGVEPQDGVPGADHPAGRAGVAGDPADRAGGRRVRDDGAWEHRTDDSRQTDEVQARTR